MKLGKITPQNTNAVVVLGGTHGSLRRFSEQGRGREENRRKEEGEWMMR